MSIFIAIASYIGCFAVSVLIADFITGIMHWAEDTWLAPGKSALLDRFIVTDNIDHHRNPGKIRVGNYWATNRVTIALAAIATALLLLFHVHAWEVYFVVAILSQSNQIHMWAHSSRNPRIVTFLQRYGILQSAAHHAKHHKNPYASRFCTVTEYLNPVLDGIGFWHAIEKLAVRCGATVQRTTAARGGF
jgi:hypothetical protein